MRKSNWIAEIISRQLEATSFILSAFIGFIQRFIQNELKQCCKASLEENLQVFSAAIKTLSAKALSVKAVSTEAAFTKGVSTEVKPIKTISAKAISTEAASTEVNSSKIVFSDTQQSFSKLLARHFSNPFTAGIYCYRVILSGRKTAAETCLLAATSSLFQSRLTSSHHPKTNRIQTLFN